MPDIVLCTHGTCNGDGLEATEHGTIRGCQCNWPAPRTISDERINEALEVSRLIQRLAAQNASRDPETVTRSVTTA
jgi:hypothetical protein